jgi:hypothetical protein
MAFPRATTKSRAATTRTLDNDARAEGAGFVADLGSDFRGVGAEIVFIMLPDDAEV